MKFLLLWLMATMAQPHEYQIYKIDSKKEPCTGAEIEVTVMVKKRVFIVD
jgi:hypothetical protein